jgi:putative thiamine transport system permease protein
VTGQPGAGDWRPAAPPARSPLLAAAPWIAAAVLAPPLAGGLVGAVAAAPLSAWRLLAAEPGIGRSILTSVLVAVAATLISAALAGAIAALVAARPGRAGATERLALVLVAAPHAAVAVGLAFLIAPTGLLFRLAGDWVYTRADGRALPPDLPLPGDAWGLSLIAGLVVKEMPFLLALTIAAQERVGARAALDRARSLGWPAASAWWRVVAPQIWPLLRLPVAAVAVYGLGTVDMALVLGPSLPPVLAVRSLSLLFDPDPARAAAGAAAALLQLVLAVGVILAGLCIERLVRCGGADRLIVRPRRPLAPFASRLAAGLGLLVLVMAMLAVVTLVFWAGAAVWRFPDPLPAGWSTARLTGMAAGLAPAAGASALYALLPVIIAVPLALLLLEGRARHPAGDAGDALIYLPLLLPPAAFLAGLQGPVLRLGLDGTGLALVWCHLATVFPYVFLALRESYRRTDPRPRRLARSLGRSGFGAWAAVMLPLTARPLAVAAAIGFSAGVAQYLPAVMIGGGWIPLLATEAVAAAAGLDRRAAAAAALLLALLPAAGFLLASLIPEPAGGRRRR